MLNNTKVQLISDTFRFLLKFQKLGIFRGNECQNKSKIKRNFYMDLLHIQHFSDYWNLCF